VHQLEHRIYPLAMRWFAEGRLQLDGDSAMLDGVPLPACGTLIRA
jgi:phosphoribosylglycinamide formyltransferase-1